MNPGLKASARRVQAALAASGFAFDVREFPDSTRTSAEAAAAIGCSVAQIAKSLVFRGAESGNAVLIIASGASPNDAPFVLDDLASRLRAASCYRLHELDDPGKEQLLLSVAREHGFELPGEVTQFLLRRGDRDVAALLSSFAQIEHAALADQRRLTVPLAKRVLGL